MVQMSASLEDLSSNYKKIMTFCEQACSQGVELICFPEMALIGYGFEALETRLKEQDRMLDGLLRFAQSNKITILVGGVERIDKMDYICQYVISRSIETYHKIHVGSREQKYIAFGEEIKVFDVQGIKLGAMLCYDGHFPDLCSIMKSMGVQIIFNPSASPNNPEKRVAMWEKYLIARAYDNRCVLMATNLLFKGKGGGMLIIDSDGNKVNQCVEEEDVMLITTFEASHYEANTMKQRDFTLDRRQEVYNRYRVDGSD